VKIKFQDFNSGDVVFERDLLPSQVKFWESESRFILFSGGVGCGKSHIMLLRAIYECMRQDNNYFLLGRTTYGEIHDVLIKEFFEICHDSWIKEYRKSPHPTIVLHTFNGGESTMIFRNLDKQHKDLLGLNLGGFAIDQAEDIPEDTFLTLKGRLRREGIDHKVFMTSNPKLSWLYRVFKQDPEENYELIEGSTLENEGNLPAEYIADLKRYPPTWYKQYVEGIWDETLLADNIVFAREFIEKISKHTRPERRKEEGLRVYADYNPEHDYQMGIDCAEGADTTEDTMRKSPKDNAVIVIWDKTADEEVAIFSAKVSPRVLAHKAVEYAAKYGDPLMVPEMNSMGAALLDKLDELGYSNIYRRKEYDRVLKKQLKKLGFRTTASTKMLLISHFEELCRLREPKIHTRETYEEMKTFVYTDVAKKKGAGAQDGFHDDKIMATLLAAFDEDPVRPGSAHYSERATLRGDDITPSVTVVNGRIRPDEMFTEGRKVNWKVT